MKQIIRRIIKEEYLETIEISADEFLEYLEAFQYDWFAVTNIKKFRNKNLIIDGVLQLEDNKISSFGNIIKINGHLGLYDSSINNFGKLKEIDGSLVIDNTDVISLNNINKILGNLTIKNNSSLEDFGDLQVIGGAANFKKIKMKTLDNILFIGSSLDIRYNENIKSLGTLTKIKNGSLDAHNSSLEDLGNLKYVGGYLNLRGTPLSEITTEEEIRSKIYVGDDIFL